MTTAQHARRKPAHVPTDQVMHQHEPQQPADNAQQELGGLQQLLQSDEQIRAACDEVELAHLIVNETRRITGARQVFLMRLEGNRRWRATAVSSVALVDRDTPLIRWIEGIVRSLASENDIAKQTDFTLPAFADKDADETRSYPFREICWHPLQIDGKPFAGLMIAREQPWRFDDLRLIGRQVGVYTHAWQALHGAKAMRPRASNRRWLAVGAALTLGIVACIPVPLTTLAPVEIVAAAPEIVTAPIDGVIKTIAIDPNRQVVSGAVLFRLEDTILTNRFELADRELRVAKARFERAQQAALYDSKARHELVIAKTEYQLKQAERNYAASLRENTIIRARKPGLLIYTSRDDWLGRPVKTGEKIMFVAEPNHVLARIELPVADAIAIEKGAHVRLFLDASPLNALPAQVTTESYHASPNSNQQLVYTLQAELNTKTRDPSKLPRIGARGTAQVFGTSVPLVFFLFRRPITFIRQSLGF